MFRLILLAIVATAFIYPSFVGKVALAFGMNAYQDQVNQLILEYLLPEGTCQRPVLTSAVELIQANAPDPDIVPASQTDKANDAAVDPVPADKPSVVNRAESGIAKHAEKQTAPNQKTPRGNISQPRRPVGATKVCKQKDPEIRVQCLMSMIDRAATAPSLKRGASLSGRRL